MQNLTLNFKLNLPATNLCIVQSIIHSDEKDEVFCQLCMNDRMSSVLLSAARLGFRIWHWVARACIYHRYGHKALEYFIQFCSDLEKREKNHSVYIKSISSFNSLMHLLLESSALILLMTALLKPWTFS